MDDKKILIVKNISREGPGLIQSVLEENHRDYEIVDLSIGEAFPNPANYSSLIVLGGPDSANDSSPKIQDEIQKVREAVDEEIPYLGICLGMQVLVKAKEGRIVKSLLSEVGFIGPEGEYFTIHLTRKGKADPLFYGIESPMNIFHLHGESVRLTNQMALLATGYYCRNQAVKVGNKAYGFQGHLELTDSMLEEWIAQDEWLKRANPDLLRREYRTIKEGYRHNANTIFNNFLNMS